MDNEVGLSLQRKPLDGSSPEDRLMCYGDLVAPLSRTLPPLERVGRNDPIAMLGRGIGHRDDQRKRKKAEEKIGKGKSEKGDELEGGLKWVSRSPSGCVHLHY